MSVNSDFKDFNFIQQENTNKEVCPTLHLF